MSTLNSWINFNGNAEEALTFYKSVFGGEFTKVVRFKDLASDEFQVPEKEVLQKCWNLFQKPTPEELAQFDEVFIYKDRSGHPND